MLPANVLERNFLLTLSATFLLFLAVSAFVLMPRQLWELGASESVIGWIMGTMQLTTAVAMPLVGLVLHRVGSRTFMVGGGLIFAASCGVLAGLERVDVTFYLARAAQGLGFAAFFVSAGAMVVRLVPDARRAEGIAIWGTGVLVTQAMAPMVGEWVVDRGSFADLYALAGAACVGAAVVSALLPKHRPSVTVPSSLGRLLRRPAVATGLLALLASSLGFGTIYAFLSAFAEREQLGPVAPYFAAYTVSSIAVRVLAGRLADRYDRRLVIVPALVVGAASLVAIALAREGWQLTLAGATFGVGSGLSSPALMAFVVDQAEPDDRPRAVALDNWSFTLGMLIAAMGFGPVAEWLGMRATFGLVAAVGVAAALALLALGRLERPTAPTA